MIIKFTYLTTLISIIFLTSIFAQQNKIQNPGFEGGKTPKSRHDRLQDDIAGPWVEPGTDGESGNADLFDVNYVIPNGADPDDDLGIPNNYFGRQFPRGGIANNKRYAGLEVKGIGVGAISSKLSTSLTCCNKYKIVFYASRADNYSKGDLSIRFRLAKGDGRFTHGDKPDVFVTSNISNTGGTEDTTWIKHSGTFTMNQDISDNEEKNIIVLRTKSPITTRKKYAYIDDLSLTLVQEDCDRTSKCLSITQNQSHNVDAPFCIWGLDNVSLIEFEIFNISLQTVRTISVRNPQSTFCWDGKNQAGNELTDQIYGFEGYIENNCIKKEIGGTFDKANPSNIPTNPSIYINFNSVTKPPKPCCIFDIHLQNEVLIQDKTLPGNLQYIAGNSITAGPNVTIPTANDVQFIAGNNITLLPGFSVDNGANFQASIGGCTSSSKTGEYISNNNSISTSEELVEDTELVENKLLSTDYSSLNTYPNPFNTSIVFEYELLEENYITLTIHNIFGKEISKLINNQPKEKGTYQIEFNASDLPPGIYFYTFQTNNNKITRKMMKVE